MSIHFAPQWVKPIKPTGASITPTAEHPSNPPKSAGSGAAQHPFPALSSSGGHHHPSSQQTTSNPALSYSRATHTPTTPGFPSDSSYFPYTAEPNGAGHGEVRHPFRYSRDQILALWDEEKVKETPIELADMLDGGGVLLAQGVVRPNGLRELSDIEKKLLATTVHPPNPSRRAGAGTTDASGAAGTPAARRTIGANAGGEKVATPGRGATAFGGFGTGKIGTIGGGLISPGANGDGRIPGALGGGFGGVGRRTTRKTEAGDGSAWRPTRTASGTFEGVLGFAGAPAPPSVNTAAVAAPSEANGAPQSPWKEKAEPKEKPAETFGSGGGPGWGTGQKKWRLAAGRTATDPDAAILDIPVTTRENLTESVAASPSATPLPERDAQIAEETQSQLATPAPAPPAVEAAPTLQEKEDLGAVEWFYRDPGGQEQGPFTGSQMHDWYSHSYFTDDLPLRRSSETAFRPLADLKTATGSAVQPFLTPVRPRLPPNLPIPAAAAGGIGGVTDSLRNIGLSTPISAMASPQASFNQYIPERAVHSPNHFAPHNAFSPQVPSAPGAYLPSPGQWGAPQPRLTSFGSVGMPSPIGSAALAYGQQPQHAPQVYSPVIGGPIGRDGRDFFSPGVGVGAPQAPSPWGAPQPQQVQQHQPYPQSIPQPVWQLPQQPQQPQPVQAQPQPQPPVELAPPLPQEEPSYFPQTEEAAPVAQQPEATTTEEQPEAFVEPEVERESTDKDGHSELSDPVPETPAHVENSPVPEPKAAPAPPVSVWGKTKTPAPSAPSSRKSSFVAATTPAPLQQVTLAKPASPAAVKSTPVETPVEEKPATEKAAASTRPAPWADKEGRSQSTGPSLREIQEAEAKEAQARKAARAAAASPAPVSAGSDDIPQNLTWGLPTSAKSSAPAAPAVTSPAPAVWGSGDAGPKKTLKQIQEEEEKQRKAKAAQAAKAAQGTAASGAAPAASKRGYADLAATSQPPGAGWTTVGATKAPATPSTPAPARPTAASVVKPATTVSKPATPAAVKPKTNGVSDAGPSLDFIKWAKQSLDGLKINVDEFVQMILTFPIDPPAAEKPTYLEMISETVYANSNTLDGRRFAQEFFTKRKADAAKPKAAGQTAVAKSSLADVVKSVPKKAEDAGFRVVKAKGKKKN